MLGSQYQARRDRTCFSASLFTAMAASILGLLGIFAPADAQNSPQSAPAAASRNTALPAPLSADDVARYRRIFVLQGAARWAEADREIAGLGDRLLMGNIEAQRYLSPHYRTDYAELSAWLASYADEPDAGAVYTLATNRKAEGMPPLTRPMAAGGSLAAYDEDDVEARPVRGGDFDEIDGADDTDTSRNAPSAIWSEGLEAWRRGHIEDALRRFEGLAHAANQSPWTISAAAFWAARAELRSRHPEQFDQWLAVAAEHSRTFYGLLARRTLGVDSYLDFEPEAFTELDAQILTGVPAGKRALALLQVGDTGRAEAELRTLASRAAPNVVQTLLALTERANMPELSVSLSQRMAAGATSRHERGLYPMPGWTPKGGFKIDRALLYALMRQESKFQPVAHNASGASGLMQLMPGTARAMASHLALKSGRFNDPEINLALAQQYVSELLEDGHINGNLLLAVTAYNVGAGGVARYQGAPGTRSDPLMFAESISNHETRIFVHHVLTNYWIYRQRLGQPTPDLDALAAGEWPTYTALDNRADRIRHAQN